MQGERSFSSGLAYQGVAKFVVARLHGLQPASPRKIGRQSVGGV